MTIKDRLELLLIWLDFEDLNDPDIQNDVIGVLESIKKDLVPSKNE